MKITDLTAPGNTSQARATDAAIENMESALNDLMEWQHDITIRQFRRLKTLRAQ